MNAAATAIDRFVADCRRLFADDLQSVFLCGSAAAAQVQADVSECNLVVVLQEARLDLLKLAAERLAEWRKSGLGFPLFLDAAFIRDGARLFPIEFSEMKREHRMLYGPDPLLDLAVGSESLRAQCAYELQSKLLALRQGYLEAAGSAADVLALAENSLKPFLVVLRNALTLLGESAPPRLADVLDRVEARWGVALPTSRRLLAVRMGEERARRSEIEALFGAYLDEVSAVTARFPETLGREGGAA